MTMSANCLLKYIIIHIEFCICNTRHVQYYVEYYHEIMQNYHQSPVRILQMNMQNDVDIHKVQKSNNTEF